jgi:N-hydroxyarylamine O-acetyltransferase
VNVERYLQRIGYAGGREPTAATLKALQRAHMLAVPFENLDIHLGRRLVLDRAVTYEKIVGRRRGGWCFELNGLFAWLLEQLGFKVTLLGSRVDSGDSVGSDLAHLLLRVDLDQPLIVDVGFGDGPLRPVPLSQLGGGVIEHLDGLRVVFTLRPRDMEEFQPMCDHLQTSPSSVFVQTRIVTMALPAGRLKLRELTLTEQVGGSISERELAGEDEWRAVLRDRFGLDF